MSKKKPFEKPTPEPEPTPTPTIFPTSLPPTETGAAQEDPTQTTPNDASSENPPPTSTGDEPLSQRIDVPAPPLGRLTVGDTADVAMHRLIWQLEERAAKGHGLDVDRELMKDAAALIRFLLTLPDEGGLLFPAQPSPTTPADHVNDPPAGHSLP